MKERQKLKAEAMNDLKNPKNSKKAKAANSDSDDGPQDYMAAALAKIQAKMEANQVKR